jgi:hypothetical protein
MKTLRKLALLLTVAGPLAILATTATGCAVETGDESTSEDELTQRADAEWFYTGSMPALEQPKITVSLKGHTAHLTGLLPQGTTLPSLPHVKTKLENGRTRVDATRSPPRAPASRTRAPAPTPSIKRSRTAPTAPRGLRKRATTS